MESYLNFLTVLHNGVARLCQVMASGLPLILPLLWAVARKKEREKCSCLPPLFWLVQPENSNLGNTLLHICLKFTAIIRAALCSFFCQSYNSEEKGFFFSNLSSLGDPRPVTNSQPNLPYRIIAKIKWKRGEEYKLFSIPNGDNGRV